MRQIMLFPKLDNKFTKTTKNELIKNIRQSVLSEISVLEPIDKFSLKVVNKELERAVRNGEVSIVLIKHKK